MISHKRSILNFLLMAVLVVSAIGFSVKAHAGGTFDVSAFETDADAVQATGPYDLRDRQTLFQITNIAASPVTIHVQIFDAVDGCRDNDFYDTLTPQDTHVYDVGNLTTNVATDGIGGFSTLPPVIPANSYGFVVISQANTNNGFQHESVVGAELIGNVRINAGEGYEYRTNLATLNDADSDDEVLTEDEYTFNFNSFSAPTFSDVIGYVLDDTGSGETSVTANADDGTGFIADIFRYDLNEGRLSCGAVSFVCLDNVSQNFEGIIDDDLNNQDVIGLNLGISNVLPNSRGAEALCPNDNPAATSGHILIQGDDDPGDCNANNGNCGIRNGDVFVGFVGLNDGGERGSFDSFWFPGADDDPADVPPDPSLTDTSMNGSMSTNGMMESTSTN